jgi:transposase-like protein
MARKKHSAEQIVALLRQIEVELANHKSIGQACKEAGITQQTYYRWRKEYGGLKLEQARRLKELEKENSRLRRLVTELSLEKLVLKDVAEGTSKPRTATLRGTACPGATSVVGAGCVPAVGAVARDAALSGDPAKR